MKYEDPFAYVDRLGDTNSGEYLFPFHIPEYIDPYAETPLIASTSQN
jgi:hypothetical protein